MSRKHNTTHERGRSHYRARLEARGLSKPPRNLDADELENLRRRPNPFPPTRRVRSRRQWASFAEYRREHGWEWDRLYGAAV